MGKDTVTAKLLNHMKEHTVKNGQKVKEQFKTVRKNSNQEASKLSVKARCSGHIIFN